jgi:hypothetical protein
MARYNQYMFRADEYTRTYHGEVVETVAPRHLHDHIWADEVIASIEHTSVAFAAANVDELYTD